MKLTPEQKLEAIALKYYHNYQWQPKKGDYYTTCRNDMELYKIVDEDKNYLYTKYLDRECEVSKWEKEEFLKDFGVYRVHVPEQILFIKS